MYANLLVNPSEEIDNSFVWGLSSLQSILGPTLGLSALQIMNPRLVLSVWIFLLSKSQNSPPC